MSSETLSLAGLSKTTQYAYDAQDRQTGLTYPDGMTVTTGYNPAGLPATLSSSLGPLVLATSYDAAGRLTSQHLGNGLWRTQGYYPWTSNPGGGRLQTSKLGTSQGGSQRLSFSYGYDALGNLTSLTDQDYGTASFVYDDLNRLTSAYGQSYAYDALGRFTAFAGQAYTPDATHPHAVDQVAGVDRYDYDANGNLILRHKGQADAQSLTWDFDNRLHEVYPASATSMASAEAVRALTTYDHHFYLPLALARRAGERYAYDGDGQRILRATLNGSTGVYTTTYYFGPSYEVTVGPDQAVTETPYFLFAGQPIALQRNGTPTTGEYRAGHRFLFTQCGFRLVGTKSAEQNHHCMIVLQSSSCRMRFMFNNSASYSFTALNQPAAATTSTLPPLKMAPTRLPASGSPVGW